MWVGIRCALWHVQLTELYGQDIVSFFMLQRELYYHFQCNSSKGGQKSHGEICQVYNLQYYNGYFPTMINIQLAQQKKK